MFIDRMLPRTVFLIDAVGALLSVLLLAVVLPAFESVFGMPYRVLYLLAAVASLLFVLSSCCFLLFGLRWKFRLTFVAIGNLFYCVITAAAILWFRGNLTLVGAVYFIADICIIAAIACFEMWFAHRGRLTV